MLPVSSFLSPSFRYYYYFFFFTAGLYFLITCLGFQYFFLDSQSNSIFPEIPDFQTSLVAKIVGGQQAEVEPTSGAGMKSA